MQSLLSEVNAAVWEHSKTAILQKYFDDRLFSGISERPKQHIDAVNEIGPLVSQVILSHSAKSHDFFNAHRGIYSVNVFPS